MYSKIIYTSRSLTAVHILQGMAFIFLWVGLALAFQLAAAPLASSTTRVTHQAWAVLLGISAIGAPLAAWLYGRRVVASLAISQDGRDVFIKSGALLGPSADRWPMRSLKFSPLEAGDSHGEQNFGLPRISLEVRDGKRHRTYLLALKGEEQLKSLRLACF